MKYATAWWGVVILAETDQDAEILRQLATALPTEGHHDYGEWRIVGPEDVFEHYPFSTDEVAASLIVIEFVREDAL